MLRLLIASLIVPAAASAHSSFTLPTTQCPIAHCSIYAGNVDAQVPPTAPTQRHSDPETGGSVVGLGCATNGTIIACTYGFGPTTSCGGNPQDMLVIYDNQANILYSSDCLFDSSALTSVPIISSAGDVFMSDDVTLARISPDPMTHMYPSTGGSSWCIGRF